VIGSDGSYAIRKMSGGEFESLVDWTETDVINPGRAWNRLRARCAGNELSLWANDVLLASTVDGEHADGDVALSAGTFDEGNIRIQFDDLAIYQTTTFVEANAAQLLLADDFSDEGSGWPVGDQSGSRFFYSDGEFVDEAFDSTLDQGEVALVAGSFDEAGLLSAFDNLRVSAR
jgi:hypothetical protein